MIYECLACLVCFAWDNFFYIMLIGAAYGVYSARKDEREEFSAAYGVYNARKDEEEL